MQIFQYYAKDDAGESIKGKVEARDERHAVQILRTKKLVVISLKHISESGFLAFITNRFTKIRTTDLVTFTQQLATMINSGMAITESLSILQVQVKPQMARVLNNVLREIEGGNSLGAALANHPTVFSAVYIALVQAGEASGKLDEVLVRLAETEEKRREFQSKVRGAMIYPIVIMIAMFAVALIMLVFVVPQLTSMYDELGAELPFMTQVLIGISNMLVSLWWLIIIAVGGGIYFLINWYKTKKGRFKIDEFILKLPIFGKLITQILMAEFTRTLSLLVAAGITILQALDIVSQSLSNVVFRDALKKGSVAVERGVPLGAALAQQEVFPVLMAQMIAVGEETGKLDEILLKVSKYYESESENAVKNLTTLLEPLIMVLMGVGVAFLVFAIIMPIYKLTDLF